MNQLTAVILAAGRGTRMRSRTPKVLHEICGRPMIDWVLDAALAARPDQVRVVLSDHNEVAERLAGRAHVVYQTEQKGTGHALAQVPRAALASGDVLVLNGDGPLLRPESVVRLVKAHRKTGAAATIASANDPMRRDGVIIRHADGTLDRVVELKGTGGRTADGGPEFNVGLYCFQGRPLVKALAKLSPDSRSGELYLTGALVHLSPVEIVHLDDAEEAIGVNDRMQLARASAAMTRRILERHMLAGVTIIDPASTFIDAGAQIGPDTVIEPFTVIKGQTKIGRDCRIGPHVYMQDATIADRSDCGPFAKLRPGTEIGPDVHIGSFAELVRTKVGRGSRVPHVAYLGDADVGEDVNVGAGTITANFDGARKNRTEIGDGAFVGVDTMLVAPVTLGKRSRTGAGSVVTKAVPDGATAVGVPARVIRRRAMESEAR